MTTLREAAQQALEALEVATNCLDGYYIPRGKTTLPEIEDAITALKAALEADDGMYGAKALTKAYENGWNAAKAEPVLQTCNCRWDGPLAEWQINDLMADIDPEDRDSWSFRQGVYAAEKHHGVRK